MECTTIAPAVEQKISGMKKVENEILALRTTLRVLKQEAYEVLHLMQHGTSPTEVTKEEERPASVSRFEEMRTVLHDDCGDYCESISKTLKEIEDMVK